MKVPNTARKVPATTKNAEIKNPEKDISAVKKGSTKPKIFTFEEDSIEEHNNKKT